LAVLSATAVISNTADGSGGGINNNNRLSIINSTISRNDSFFRGGGIYSNNVTDLNNVTVTDNDTNGAGGGVNVALSTVLTRPTAEAR
jgi:hypothetical protein